MTPCPVCDGSLAGFVADIKVTWMLTHAATLRHFPPSEEVATARVCTACVPVVADAIRGALVEVGL